MAKLCFISYARNSNLDGRLTRFVDKLQKQIPGHLPHGTKAEDVIFFDVRNIENGADWMQRLADAARQCKVCICFYSPPYFTSEYSGREVQVFLQRLHAWSQLPGNAGAQARAIVPVVWVPHDPLPAVLKPFQIGPVANLPPTYTKEGLHALAMRKSRSDAYNAVLNAFAIDIAKILQTLTLPDGAPIAAFDAIASAFHAPGLTRYGAAVMVLATPARRAQPFGGSSIDTMIETVANRCTVPFREIRVDAKVDSEIKNSIGAREMPVVVADRESVESPNNAGLVKKISAALNESSTVILFDAPLLNTTDAVVKLRAVAAKTFASWKAAAVGTRCLVAADSDTFVAELEKRLKRAKTELIAADPAGKAEDKALQAQAEAQGITTGAQPVLTGPGA
jgi:hypothetical protein